MPSSAIHQQDTMAASCHMKADLFEIPLHGVGVGDWQYKASALS